MTEEKIFSCIMIVAIIVVVILAILVIIDMAQFDSMGMLHRNSIQVSYKLDWIAVNNDDTYKKFFPKNKSVDGLIEYRGEVKPGRYVNGEFFIVVNRNYEVVTPDAWAFLPRVKK